MNYKLTIGGILRGDGANIPQDPDNRDYQAYRNWLDAGGSPDPADQPHQTYRKFYGNDKLDLFTPAEQLAVVTATMADPEAKLMYDRLLGAAFLTYEDPETERGLQLLVAKELLTPERKAEIVDVMGAA